MAGGEVTRVRMGAGDLGQSMGSLLQPSPQQQNQSSIVANSSNITSRVSNYGKMDPAADEFPAGMRVLVVDDDPVCLALLENMLRRCAYHVTKCGMATHALDLLRENKDTFDLVISDVYMPDMDGFKLLELVGLEMDLPVIMMSANGETSAVMKGITHGACDYLLKPVRIEELRNIWQHVVRKKRNESKDVEHSTSIEEGERQKRGGEDADYTSSATDTTDGNWKFSKKRKEIKDDDEDNDPDNDDPSTLKKPRVVWSVELHQQFVSAVNQLGIDKAVPKRILELMNVQGLTRENVASHLQKYRLYLKRLSGVANQQNMGATFGGPDAPFGGLCSLDGIGDFRTLAANGQLSTQTLATLQAGVLGRIPPPSGLALNGNIEPSMLLQLAAIQGGNVGSLTRPRINPPLLGNQATLLQGLQGGIDLDQLAQSHHLSGLGPLSLPMDDGTGLSAISHQLGATGVLGGMGGLNGNNPSNNVLMMQQLIQQQQVQHQGGGSGVNLPQPAGLLGPPHLLSNNNNLGRAGPLPHMGSAVGLSGMGNGGRGHGPSSGGTSTSLSDSLGALVQAPNVDVKNLCPPVGNFPVSVAVSTASPSSGLVGQVPPVMNEGLNRQVMRPNFSMLGNLSHGLGQGLGQGNRSGWPGHQGGMEHREFGQALTPVLRPHYNHSQVSTPSQNPSPGKFAQQTQSSFMGNGMNFPGRLALDVGPVRPSLNGGQGNTEQSHPGSERKLPKDDHILITAKLEGGLMSHDTPSDDFLNFFFKQQSEGISFAEGELGTDGYPLDNLYVK